MRLEDAHGVLRRPMARSAADESELKAALAEMKAAAVRLRDHVSSKHVWCLETTLEIQEGYQDAFGLMKDGKFHDAWRGLAGVETTLGHLGRHTDLSDFSLSFIRDHIARFQSLFPYRTFLSCGFIVRERRCGLCDAVVSPRRGCGHRLGEIYDGVMCFHEITDAEIAEVSLVTEPVDKACVFFPVDAVTGEQLGYAYPLVEYVAACLASPYHAWECRRTQRRHPHAHFRDVPSSSPCPCGSGTAYGVCCQREGGVLLAHCAFRFEVPPTVTPPSQLILRAH